MPASRAFSLRLLPIAFALLLGAPLPAQQAPSPSVGILVMAHGGSPEWNASVDAALTPLRGVVPTALAFGMADRATMAAALDSLREVGVGRVAVVRMFLSGDSFRDQTDYLLGLSPEPPAMYMHHGPEGHTMIPTHAMHAAHAGHGAGAMTLPPPIPSEGLEIATHDDGVKDWAKVGSILEERALALSRDPARERVLVLAHGMGDDAENQAVLDDLAAAIAGFGALGFAEVRPETLREDWPEARVLAEARIHDFMRAAEAAGDDVIVVPFRLSGFGPYAKVLEGFAYREGEGLLPHDSLTEWVLERAAAIATARGWTAVAAPLPFTDADYRRPVGRP